MKPFMLQRIKHNGPLYHIQSFSQINLQHKGFLLPFFLKKMRIRTMAPLCHDHMHAYGHKAKIYSVAGIGSEVSEPRRPWT
jgi:hypothetical protein